MTKNVVWCGITYHTTLIFGDISMKTKSIIGIVIGVFVLLLACGALSVTLFIAQQRFNDRAETAQLVEPMVDETQSAEVARILPTPVSDEIIAQADAEETLLINLYQRVNPSVVNIDVVLNTNFQHPAIPGNGDEPAIPPEEFSPFFSPQGQGSGFVYSDEGYIITNNHVIENAAKVTVTFFDGEEFLAEVVGMDADSDLAVIKIDAPAERLVPVTWGNSDNILVGQRAVAIGNPFGLSGSLTTGIVSAVGRDLPSVDRFLIPEIIQTDAAVNPGNSGGPLLDSHGDVIGVVSAIVPRQLGTGERSFLGVGFAIPSNLAQKVLPTLIANGRYEHPWVGISGTTISPEIATAMDLDEAQGALVIFVLPDSPASKAGIRGGDTDFVTEDGIPTQVGGDVIIAIEDEPVKTFDDLISFSSRRGQVGESVTLTVIRDGKTKTVDLVLEARPKG